MNRVIPLFLFFIISSCSSVPLSTIARMSTFDSQDFAALNPDELRVKVTLPRGFEVDAETSWLGIDIISPAGQHHGVFELNQESVQSENTSEGFFSEPEQVVIYLLSLSSSSRAKFSDLQQFISKATAEDTTIRVVPKLASYPPDATSVKVSVDLLLYQSQGFLTLVDAARLPLGKLVKSKEN